MEMLEIFNPLIKRYARLLDYEDAKYDLIEQFYRCIYKIPIDNYKFKEEKYIVSYINKSIIHAYIKLEKIKNSYNDKIYLIEDINLEGYSFEPCREIILKEFLNGLSTYEKELFIKKFVNDLSDKEIAIQYSKSRQTVSKSINKIKNKLQHYLYLEK